MRVLSVSLIQAAKNSVSNQPERIFWMAAEGGVDNDQGGILSTAVFVKNYGVIICTTGRPIWSITGDEKFFLQHNSPRAASSQSVR